MLKCRQFALYWFRKDKEEGKEEGGGEIRVRGVEKRRERRGGGEGDGRKGGKREEEERKKEQRDEGEVTHFIDMLRKEAKLFSFWFFQVSFLLSQYLKIFQSSHEPIALCNFVQIFEN